MNEPEWLIVYFNLGFPRLHKLFIEEGGGEVHKVFSMKEPNNWNNLVAWTSLVFSTITTASAPGGTGAPVLILTISPGSRKCGLLKLFFTTFLSFRPIGLLSL